MSHLAINGKPLQGQVYALKLAPGQSLEDAQKAGQHDGLDQVYFESQGKIYFAEGDGLELSALNSKKLPELTFKLHGQEQSATLLAVDNETNTAWEGVKSVGAYALGLTGLSGAGAYLSAAKLKAAAATLQGTQSTLAGLAEGSQTLKTAVGQVQQAIKPLSAAESYTVAISKQWSTVKVDLPANYAARLKSFGQAARDLTQAEASLAQTSEKIAVLSKGATGAVKEGLEAYGKSVAGLSQQVQAAKLGVQAGEVSLKSMPQILQKSFSHIPSGMSVKTTISSGGLNAGSLESSLANGLKSAEGASQNLTKVSAGAVETCSLAKKGLYAAGAVAAVAGVTLLGAAVYGAAKSADRSGLEAYRQKLDSL